MQKTQGKAASNEGSATSPVDSEALVRTHIGWMLALADRLLRDRDLAEDAVQEAFIAAFRGLPDFEGRSSLKTWLRRITLNAALTQLRRRERLAEQPIDDLLPVFDESECRIERPWSALVTVEEGLHSDDCRERGRWRWRRSPRAYERSIEIGRALLPGPDDEIPEDVPEDLIKAVLFARDAG